jgi:hypothetical protein
VPPVTSAHACAWNSVDSIGSLATVICVAPVSGTDAFVMIVVGPNVPSCAGSRPTCA